MLNITLQNVWVCLVTLIYDAGSETATRGAAAGGRTRGSAAAVDVEHDSGGGRRGRAEAAASGAIVFYKSLEC